MWMVPSRSLDGRVINVRNSLDQTGDEKAAAAAKPPTIIVCAPARHGAHAVK